MAPVDRPTTLETFLCDCQGPHKSDRIAIGEICTFVEGSDVVVRDRDGGLISRHHFSNHVHCKTCADSRIYRPAPLLYYADEFDVDWDSRWASEDFDRNLRASVLEFEPGQWQVWDVQPDGSANLRMDRVREQWTFATPHDLNHWWMQPISAQEQDELRNGYEKLRLKAACG